MKLLYVLLADIFNHYKMFSGILTWYTSQGSDSPLSPPGCRDSLRLIGEQEQPMGWRDAVVLLA